MNKMKIKKESLFTSNSLMWCHQEPNRGHKAYL